MRIAFLADASLPHTQRWLRYFVDRQHDCLLLSLEPGDGYECPTVWMRPWPRLPRFARYTLNVPAARRRLNAFRPDVVNAHFLPNYGWMAARAGARPLVLTTLGSDVLLVPRRTFLHAWRTRWVLRRCDRVTADAQVLARAVTRFGYDAERVLTVPFGVDLEAFDRAARSKPRTNGPILALSTRRLEPVYDVPTLFRAATYVTSELRDSMRLRIAGAGAQAAELHAASRSTTVLPETTFLGWLEPAALMQELVRAHVYVSTSRSDSTSVSLLEAMAAGCLPVVTDIEGNREWIRDGENGLLFPVGDDAALARCLERAVRDAELRHSAATLNRALIVERATWSTNMERVERLFAELLRNPGAPATALPQG